MGYFMVKMLSLVSLAFFSSLGLSIETGAPESQSPVLLTRIKFPTGLSVDTNKFLTKLENCEAKHSSLEFEETIAQCLIGFKNMIDGIKAYQNGKWSEAFSHFKNGAQNPYMVETKYLLGSMYMAGIGTAKDTNLGQSYLSEAMFRGSKRAELDLEKLKSNIASDGSSFTQKNLDLLTQVVAGIKAWQRKEYLVAHSLLHQAYLQDQGLVELTYLLGNAYFASDSPEWGLIFLQVAEARGYPQAAFDLGLRYYLSRGVAQNFEQAAFYFDKYPLDVKFRYHLGLAKWQSLALTVKKEGLKHIRWAKKNGYSLALHALSEGEIILLDD